MAERELPAIWDSEGLDIPGEGAAVLEESAQLLGWVVERYTMGESSSVTVETARELMRSVRFSLELARRHPSCGKETSPRERLELGRRITQEIQKATEQKYRALRENCRTYQNRAMEDTLAEIGGFFRRYDAVFFAHDIPCMIDYPLCLPVPEEAEGILYIREYLRRLETERGFLEWFAQDAVLRLLRAHLVEIRELVVNLFEPVFAAALMIAAVQGDIGTLLLGRGEAVLLAEQWEREADWEEMVSAGLARLVTEMGITDPDRLDYLSRTLRDLLPRLRTAREHGRLQEHLLRYCVEREEPAPSVVSRGFVDGERMPDEALRAVIEEMQECRTLEEKMRILMESVHSLRDLAEALDTCFWEGEWMRVFALLGETEQAVLLGIARGKLGSDPAEWRPGWEKDLQVLCAAEAG